MLEPRLSLCAEMVKGDYICDVGTDHAYLPAELIISGKCRRAIAADIKENPLLSAKATIEKYGLTNRITTVLSDGLDNIDLTDVTDISIAGMGGEMIINILGKCDRIKPNVDLILQPMTKAPLLRRYLCENGYEIISEKAVCERKFCYSVISARKNGVKKVCSDVDAEIGAMDLSLPDERIYALKRAEKLEKTAKSVSSSDISKCRHYMEIAKKIRNKLKETEI